MQFKFNDYFLYKLDDGLDSKGWTREKLTWIFASKERKNGRQETTLPLN